MYYNSVSQCTSKYKSVLCNEKYISYSVSSAHWFDVKYDNSNNNSLCYICNIINNKSKNVEYLMIMIAMSRNGWYFRIDLVVNAELKALITLSSMLFLMSW